MFRYLPFWQISLSNWKLMELETLKISFRILWYKIFWWPLLPLLKILKMGHKIQNCPIAYIEQFLCYKILKFEKFKSFAWNNYSIEWIFWIWAFINIKKIYLIYINQTNFFYTLADCFTFTLISPYVFEDTIRSSRKKNWRNDDLIYSHY